MATTIDIGTERSVALSANINRLEGDGPRFSQWLLIHESDVDLYVVTDAAAVNSEGTVPSTGRFLVKAANLPAAYDIRGYGQIGLAQTDTSGTARVECKS